MNRHQPYRQKPLQIPADHIRADTCDTRRFMNPHLGIWDEPATDPGYWHVSPNGEKAHLTTIVHCSLYIVHCQSYTFSAKERDSETGLSYFGSRYYSSDLSVWLSVDPMSDKYPSLSPYTYCANNPVKVVDPNGEAWETPEDESTANKLITCAEKQIKSNNNLIKQSEKRLQRGKISQEAHDDFVNDIKGQNSLLEEGIEGIQNMGTDKQVFHFNIVNGSTRHNVNKAYNGDKYIIKINVNEQTNIQWHECVHVIDYLNDPSNHNFNKEGYLGSTNSLSAETHAYRSEWSFSRDGTRFPQINRLYDINESFVKKRMSYDKQ